MKDEMKTGFLMALWLLRDYLPDIVIGGGWVPMIYYHYVVGDKNREPIRTRDIDILTKEKVPVRGEKTLDRLLLDAGLSPILKGHGRRPAVSYEGEIEDVEVEIEFLTHQKGPKGIEIITVQENLYAQALRFISVSLENTMKVEIDDFYVGGEPRYLEVLVPTPAAFIFHKGLVFRRRNNHLKKAKDLYYIFDILANLEGMERQIYEGMAGLKKKYPTWFKTFMKNLGEFFRKPTSEGIELVSGQRPSNAFTGLTNDQFRLYVLGIFGDFILKIKSR